MPPITRSSSVTAGDSTSTGPPSLARWAIRTAGAVTAVLVVSSSIFAVTWAIGGEDAVSDTFVGYLAGFAVVAGMLASLVAFAMAVVARVKRERLAWLWFPLVLFPGLVVVVALVEALWAE